MLGCFAGVDMVFGCSVGVDMVSGYSADASAVDCFFDFFYIRIFC